METPPPLKSKVPATANNRNLPDFSALDERCRRAAAAGAQVTREIAEAVADIARAAYVLCVDEARSPLGREAHIDAVLRRLRQGEPGAVLLDGHFLLTDAACSEELAIAARVAREGRA